jgi:hypothetical protein
MPILTINHKTKYRYAHPMAFGGHRSTLRPPSEHICAFLHIAAPRRPLTC